MCFSFRMARLALVLVFLQLGAALVSAQLRLRIFAGASLGENYAPLPMIWVGIILVTSIIGALVIARLRAAASHRVVYFGVLLLTFVGTAVLLPDLSLLQLAYWVIAAIVLGMMTLRPYRPNANLLSDLQLLWERRALIVIWTRYTVRSRYSQTLLGILWIILLPLSTAAVFAVVFSEFLRASPRDDLPFFAYFFTGLTFWTAFSQSISTGTTSILNKLGLMNQVYFPREILVIVKLFEVIVDTSFTFATLVVVNLLYGLFPSPYYVMLPLVLLIQFMLTLGLMFFISTLSVIIRDVPQLVGVGLQIMFYLTPILYSVSDIPQHYQFLALINPLVPLIDAYRAILLYNTMPDIVSLFYPLVAGVSLMFLGYRYFKQRERLIVDYV